MDEDTEAHGWQGPCPAHLASSSSFRCAQSRRRLCSSAFSASSLCTSASQASAWPLSSSTSTSRTFFSLGAGETEAGAALEEGSGATLTGHFPGRWGRQGGHQAWGHLGQELREVQGGIRQIQPPPASGQPTRWGGQQACPLLVALWESLKQEGCCSWWVPALSPLPPTGLAQTVFVELAGRKGHLPAGALPSSTSDGPALLY